ncbi:MAG: hypothetical protein FJX65_13295 [Alphaproteobacteria bacterium]|nr:hypothetical protein [Alphaproteobacteria bacterium]
MPNKQVRYLIEFHRVGLYVKVSAIDPETNIEASIVGDPRATEAELERLAVRKLEYVLAKKRGDGSSGGTRERR